YHDKRLPRWAPCHTYGMHARCFPGNVPVRERRAMPAKHCANRRVMPHAMRMQGDVNYREMFASKPYHGV
ncbi:hypothetical protein HAX54_039549, partial [Datura stramonium]|nr:hypothetical protein [Datura stramonium]